MKVLSKFGVELYEKKLSNGADVFLFKRKGFPIYIRSLFFAGSRFDTTAGTAHFLEHMLLAGTEKFPSKNLIADNIQKVGGEFGAGTNGNFLRINIEIPESKDLPIGIGLLDQCLNHSLFNPQTLENERGSILSELNSKKSHPSEYNTEAFNSIAFQGTALERSVLGDTQEVGAINLELLLKHKESFINSGRVCFIVAGDANIDEISTLLESIKLPIRNKFELEGHLPVIKETMLKVEPYPGVDQLQVQLGCRTTVSNYKEYCALHVLNSILAVGRGSRLATKLRYENGLIYSVSGNVVEGGDWGLLKIKLACDKNKWAQAEQIIFETFDDIKSNGVTQNELETTKAKISKGMIRNLQTSESWVNMHDINAIFNPSLLHTAEDYVEAINSISHEDLIFVAHKYLNKEDFYTSICGDY